MKPTMAPCGVRTVAVTISSPTSDAGTCSLAPARDRFGNRRVDVGHSPIRERTLGGVPVRQETKFVAVHVEPDIERLVEIGAGSEQVGPPCLRCVEVRRGIDNSAQSEQRRSHAEILPDKRAVVAVELTAVVSARAFPWHQAPARRRPGSAAEPRPGVSSRRSRASRRRTVEFRAGETARESPRESLSRTTRAVPRPNPRHRERWQSRPPRSRSQ